MPAAPKPSNESMRLASVRRLAALRAVKRPVDLMLKAVSTQLGVEHVAVSIVDDTTQHPLLTERRGCLSSSRDHAFCAHVVYDESPLIVPDAANDPRFEDNELVASGQYGFYYGYPVYTPDGHVAGSLCVYGPGARQPSDKELRLIESMASIISEQIRTAWHALEADREHENVLDRLRRLVLHTPAAVAVFDNDMRYLAVSNRFRQDYRLGDIDMLGRSHYEVFPELPDAWRDDHARCLKGESLSSDEEQCFERADGTTDHIRRHLEPWRHTNGDIGGLMMFTEVVTNDVLRNRQLVESARWLDLALRSANAGIWDWNPQTGEVCVTDSWWEMLGCTGRSLTFNTEEAWEMIYPADCLELERAIKDILDGDAEAFELSYRMIRGDGELMWVSTHGYAVNRDESGDVTRLVGLTMDTHTQRMLQIRTEEHAKDLEDAKNKLEDQAAELMALNYEARIARREAEAANAAKSRFLANMSHEIRTPMTAILGYLDILESAEMDTPIREDANRTIRRNAEHLLELINDILDLSKLDAQRMRIDHTECKTRSIIDDSVCIVRPLAEHKKIDFRTDVDRSVPESVMIDPVRIRQIIVNLLSNAIKFTPESGRVSFGVAYAGGCLTIEVEDSGIGMTEEQADRVFAPFEQADSSTTRSHGGTGLGLTISRQLAQALGGDLTIVRSTPGKGTLMRAEVCAARARALAPSPPAKAEPERPASLAGLRVLLVEDGPDNQKLLTYLLKKAGAQVTVAENGLEACTRCTGENGPPFDVILMDMQMPVMDGYEATRRLRGSGITVPIIALTANSLDGDRERCLQAGCNDYESKPVPADRLIAACARWSGHPSATNAAA